MLFLNAYTACKAVGLLLHLSKSPTAEAVKYRMGNSEDSLSPESPLSPHFTPPPIRNAALRSMFPQVYNAYTFM